MINTSRMEVSPRISVLLPLKDERGAGIECMRAWTEQTVDPAIYEVVALVPGGDRRLERATRSLMRPGDQWLELPGSSELLNAGAEAARGEFIFLTESHCVPEADCLEAMLEELDRTGAPGVRGADSPDAQGPIGELERDAFLQEIVLEEDPNHWRKILVHSLALRRDLYLDAGGLPPRYGAFGAWVLGIVLDARGERLEFSPRPRVRHVYDGHLSHVREHLFSFGRGETRYRSDVPESLAEHYLGITHEWEERLAHTRDGARRALRAAVALRHPGTVGVAMRHLAVATLGPRASIAAAALESRLAALIARASRLPKRRTWRFGDFWRLTVREGRIAGLAERSADPPDAPVAQEVIDLTASHGGRVIGFHDPEPVEGEPPVRWTSHLALIRVSVPGAGRHRARLELHPLERPKGAKPARPRVAVDGRRVPASVTDDAIEFEIDGGEHWVAIACSPLRPRRHGVMDHRDLGLCARSLRFEPLLAQ